MLYTSRYFHHLPCVFFDKKSSFLNFTLNTLEDRTVVDFFVISLSECTTLGLIDLMSGTIFSIWLKFQNYIKHILFIKIIYLKKLKTKMYSHLDFVTRLAVHSASIDLIR